MIKKLAVLCMLINIGFSCSCKNPIIGDYQLTDEDMGRGYFADNFVIEGKLIKDADGNEIKELKYIDGDFVYGIGKWGGTND